VASVCPEEVLLGSGASSCTWPLLRL
jgi:hypothetical protein